MAAIPPLALSIPDFEGQSILRIFSNATQSEIGCYAARITNGNSFAQPEAVGSILGIFTLVAVLASFATAAYGTHLPTMRTHYAHSLSVFVVFAVWHHIFFTGALSMNWPSVLPAFWSNYAWSAGMIYTTAMQNSIHSLIGSTMGNPTAVGGAAKLGASSDSTGGGYQISSVYKRAGARVFGRTPMKFLDLLKSLAESASDSTLAKRSDLPNTTTGFDWYGTPVPQGLPLPGNFSGFAGTLSDENLPASNAFMTGFLWFLILVAMVAGLVVFFKLVVEGLVKAKVIPEDRLDFFREHWLTYTVMAVLRTLYIGFFMIIFLALFQFVYKGPAGVTAIATVVFLLAFLGIITLAGLACYSRLRLGTFAVVSDRIHLEADRALGFFPYLTMRRESSRMEKFRARNSLGSFPWRRITSTNRDADRLAAHEDEEFMMTYSWLSARYRKSRWWFFSIWLCYEFVRACFYGGAAGYPMVQVFGLLAVEFIALIAIIRARPFEGARLNLIMVYLLGFSKVATLALSSAFDAAFGLDRIVTAVIGIVIIVIQGLLTIILLIAIVVGAVTSYMSLTRNRETFAPKSWASRRMRYFAHIERAATDRPRTPPPPPAPEEPKAPYFTVASIRRLPKIEDEDEDVANVRSNRDSRSSTDHPQRSGTASPLQHTGPPPHAALARCQHLVRSIHDEPTLWSTPTPSQLEQSRLCFLRCRRQRLDAQPKWHTRLLGRRRRHGEPRWIRRHAHEEQSTEPGEQHPTRGGKDAAGEDG